MVNIRTTVENLRKIFSADKSFGPNREVGEKCIYTFEGETADGDFFDVYDYKIDYFFTETDFVDFHIGAENKKICEQAKREMLQTMKDKGLPEEKPIREISKMNKARLGSKIFIKSTVAILRKVLGEPYHFSYEQNSNRIIYFFEGKTSDDQYFNVSGDWALENSFAETDWKDFEIGVKYSGKISDQILRNVTIELLQMLHNEN